ncbi:glycoside hydrolase family 28 protein [Consotaella aegiceratis]|uniref:polygalacturonase PglB n=1 Tax=Consotaella aegiceratis TaxID=3097961 RepID=UPI002F404CE6
MTAAPDLPVPAEEGDATRRLQSAINAAHAAGGGRVLVEAGRHDCHGLWLKSNVELHLAPGAVLQPRPDYEAYAETRVDHVAEDSDRGILVAREAENIAITGTGTIEAGGEAFIAGDDPVMGTWIPAPLRPRTIIFDRCRNVRLENFTIRNSPMWTIHAIACRHLAVKAIAVDNDRRMPNTDGFVVDACEDVTIEDADIRTADDGVVLKTTATPDGRPIGACRRVRVANSRIESRSCALKIGTETYGDVEDIVFEDCEIVGSNRGLGIFSRDGGRIARVRFSRIAVDCAETPDGFWGSGEALTVNVVDRRPDRPAGAVTDLVVEDITGRMEGAINLVALRPGSIAGVRLDRIDLVQHPGRLGTALAYDLRPTSADLAPAPEAAGRANAWVKDAEGKVVGLAAYPGGMPGLFASSIADLDLGDVVIRRPEPLPASWNPAPIVTG